MKLRCLAIPLIFLIPAVLGCSGDKSPTSDPVYYDGKISIRNQSGVRIRILELAQTRDGQEHSYLIGRSINTGFEYFLLNMLDGGDSEIFPGGDIVRVHYVAEAPDPENPSQPLFDIHLGHTINGITVYYIKSGGRFSLHP